MSKTSNIEFKRLGAHLGAEVSGADLTAALSHKDRQAIHDALMEHEVLVFPEIDITVEQQAAFAKQFGEFSVHPFSPNAEELPELIILDNDGDSPPLATDVWHSDETFREAPPMGTILRARVLPDIGGDTVFASMTAAYDGLSSRWQNFLSGLEAVHDFKPFRRLFIGADEKRRATLHRMEIEYPNPSHPVVRVHPVTGRKAIFVNPQFTLHIKGMTETESEAVLSMLYQLTGTPEYQFRVGWKLGTMVFWDNRSTQHYAARDYLPQRRRMERFTLKGDKVLGADDAMAGAGSAAALNAKPEARQKADGEAYSAATSVRQFERDTAAGD
ncbi:MAG: TauD/TfdA family dioxygenase [Rhodospirillales bacterium]|nr:TauD/TfdA family dioxygenase [Rhodospirillales bacterium]